MVKGGAAKAFCERNFIANSNNYHFYDGRSLDWDLLLSKPAAFRF